MAASEPAGAGTMHDMPPKNPSLSTSCFVPGPLFIWHTALSAGRNNPRRGRAAEFTIRFGMVVMALGLACILAPATSARLLGTTEALKGPAGLGEVQVMGAVLWVIGWFNLLGGKSGEDWFIAGAIIDRLVTFSLMSYLYWHGRVPRGQLAAHTVLDLGGALATYMLWIVDKMAAEPHLQRHKAM